MSTTRPVSTQELISAYVHEIFKNLESGDDKGFFDHVTDDADWIVEGAPKAISDGRALAPGRDSLVASGLICDPRIEAAFRAAGYGPDDVNAFAGVVETRIAALNKL